METAMFGAGCFWGVEAAFAGIAGVISTLVGYSGGTIENPTYEQVCTGRTGHTEVVQIQFDPQVVSYEELLGVFWSIHDPTTLNRQGPDVGVQYRSVVFYYSEQQKALAERVKADLERSGKFGSPVVTAIEPAKPFYRAEEYHQKYVQKRGLRGCHL